MWAGLSAAPGDHDLPSNSAPSFLDGLDAALCLRAFVLISAKKCHLFSPLDTSSTMQHMVGISCMICMFWVAPWWCHQKREIILSKSRLVDVTLVKVSLVVSQYPICRVHCDLLVIQMPKRTWIRMTALSSTTIPLLWDHVHMTYTNSLDFTYFTYFVCIVLIYRAGLKTGP